MTIAATATGILHELLARAAAAPGGVLHVRDEEIVTWPSELTQALVAAQVMAEAKPASSTICTGCEQECSMPVRVPTRSSRANPFIVCDKRPDVNRVAVKLSELRQHRIAGDSIAAAIATQIDTHGATRAEGRELRWELGVFRGHHHSSHMVMTLGAEFEVSISGHLMPVGDLLVLQGGRLVVDRRSLVSLVDNPASGGGSRESKQERCQRLRARRQELRGQHVRGFVKQIAAEERLSVSRVKQILAGK